MVYRHKGSLVIRVTVLRDSLGIKIIHGTIEFFCVPVQSRSDYRLSKTNLLAFDKIKRIAEELSHGLMQGKINDLEWRRN